MRTIKHIADGDWPGTLCGIPDPKGVLFAIGAAVSCPDCKRIQLAAQQKREKVLQAQKERETGALTDVETAQLAMLLEKIMAVPGDFSDKKHAARRLLGIIRYPKCGENVIKATAGCQCDTEEKRWECNKDCINKPKIVRS
jgi:hypothetical protein